MRSRDSSPEAWKGVSVSLGSHDFLQQQDGTIGTKNDSWRCGQMWSIMIEMIRFLQRLAVPASRIVVVLFKKSLPLCGW